MLDVFLKNTITRHFRELELLIDQLNDQLVLSTPIEGGRPLGEIFLHVLRAAEYYLRGVVHDRWEPLSYTLVTYGTASSIKALYEEISGKVEEYLQQITSNMLTRVIKRFNRPATKAEILLELLEHSIHHRGQITVYYRLAGVEPTSIPYIL